jgi:pimeloyl-ACP methyl ester carboxylesterase
MTRAQGPDGEIDYRSVGVPGARVVFVLRTGALATVDPDAPTTDDLDVRLVLVHLDAPELDDPPVFGGETPAGSTVSALVDLVRREAGEGPIGLVAERDAGALGISLAADLGAGVDRLALVAVPPPASPLERDLTADVLARVSARALVYGAEGDPAADAEAARWLAEHLRHADVALVAPDAVGAGDGRLGMLDVWPRVLEHVAAGAPRR